MRTVTRLLRPLLLAIACTVRLAAASAWSMPYQQPPERVPGTVYEVGPGRTYAEIGHVPWTSLAAGDMVLIHHRPAPYVGLIGIRTQATAEAPLRVYGVRDPASGAIPVISAAGAAAGPGLSGFYTTWTRGLAAVLIHGSWSELPAHIHLANLEIRDATKGSTYSDALGTGTFGSFTSAIWARAKHLQIRSCRFANNGLGLFTQSNDDDNARVSEDVLVDACDFSGNGIVGSYTEHNIYTQGVGSTIQHCRIGRLRSGALGSSLKDRSAGTVIRYNLIDASARAIDLVEPEDSPAVVALPGYGQDYVYGNVITNVPADGGSGRMIHYGADNSPASARRRTLHFFNNSIGIIAGGPSSWPGRVDVFQITDPAGVIAARNNIIAMTVPAGHGDWDPAFLNLLVDDVGTVDLQGGNWLNSHWTEYLYGNASNGRVLRSVPPATGSAPGFVDAAGADLALAAGSTCRGLGTALPASLAASHPLLYQAGSPAAPRSTLIDAGAFESSDETTGGAPTVSAATATPATVSATTAVLTASASDDGGESALIYTWSTTPATATIRPNGSNAARAADAIFAAAGSYVVVVTVRDVDGLTAMRSITVDVQRTPTAISATSSGATVAGGGSATLSATVDDQFGTSITTAPITWSVLEGGAGGTVDASGVYTAPRANGTDRVQARSGALAAIVTLTVTDGAASSTATTPGGPAAPPALTGPPGGNGSGTRCGLGGLALLLAGLAAALRVVQPRHSSTGPSASRRARRGA